jgi:hypothetical protein
MLRADARNGTVGLSQRRRLRWRGYFFAQMNAPFYSAGPRSQTCGPTFLPISFGRS